MDLEQKGRELALAFLNLDDIVLARELSGTGMNVLSAAGRSVVGTAVIGAGIATRAAVFGAQVATKSAMAMAAAAKGRIPGAEVVEQMAYELDQSVGRTGAAASFIAVRGVEIGKADGRPPTDPILGDVWLEKRLTPGATPNTVLVDSAVDLTRMAAVPFVFGSTALADAMRSPTGQQVTRSFWDGVSSIVDSVAGAPSAGAPPHRSEKRAALLMLGMTPLWVAAKDIFDFGEALSRAAAGDGQNLRLVLTRTLNRLESAGGASASTAVQHTPSRLLSVLGKGSGEPADVVRIVTAMMEDSGNLSKLAVLYSELLAALSLSAMQSAVSGAFDVDDIESWVRADEAHRARTGSGLPERCPASVRQLEMLASPRGLAVPSTIALARDTIFSYSARAVGREAALTRMERLFGPAVRDRLRDDCSLRPEILDANFDRDRRIAALVSALRQQGRARLREARAHAWARFKSLTENSADRVLERLVPQKVGDRIVVLQRFVGMADTVNALDGVPSDETSRRAVQAKFNAWIESPAGERDAMAS